MLLHTACYQVNNFRRHFECSHVSILQLQIKTTQQCSYFIRQATAHELWRYTTLRAGMMENLCKLENFFSCIQYTQTLLWSLPRVTEVLGKCRTTAVLHQVIRPQCTWEWSTTKDTTPCKGMELQLEVFWSLLTTHANKMHPWSLHTWNFSCMFIFMLRLQ